MESRDVTTAKMTGAPKDNPGTLLSIGVLAYLSADLAHHLLGHGGACLALGGKIVRLSSIFVDCTVTGTPVDLAGPCANLAVGLLALAAAFYTQLRDKPAVRLFIVLTAGFNLLWFTLQLAFSAASRTDDFAWAMGEYHVNEWERYGLIAIGTLGYLGSVRLVGRLLAGFADPRTRVQRIVLTSWLAGGAIACVTAAFDHHPLAAIAQHAAPQSLLLSLGLLFMPAQAARRPSALAPALGTSMPWVVAAVVVATASAVFLGPGISI